MDLCSFCKLNYQLIIRVLLTTREIDWYNYSGDLSNIRSINIIVPTLEDQEAKNIFQKLKETGNLHPSITNWKRGVESNCRTETLIEYVYLLTHGGCFLNELQLR